MSFEKNPLQDKHRRFPGAEGGEYTDDNVEFLDPVDHLKEHGNYRERSELLTDLKTVCDDRGQFQKLVFKINNQLLAYQRRVDNANPATIEALQATLAMVEAQSNEKDKELQKLVRQLAKQDPLVKSALGVKGLGPVTIAHLLVYVDLSKAQSASSLWKYAGLHTSAASRYEKGKTSGGNKTLRTVLYTTATAMVRVKGAYADVYERTKTRLSQSEKLVRSRNTQGKMVECAWKDTKPSHRHGAALRAVMKHILADYWFVGRTLQGLSTKPIYAEAMLGHTSIIRPEERGWTVSEAETPIEQ